MVTRGGGGGLVVGVAGVDGSYFVGAHRQIGGAERGGGGDPGRSSDRWRRLRKRAGLVAFSR